MTDNEPDFLNNLIQPARLTSVVDVGANPIDGEPPYKAMLQRRLCTVVGFEPQDEALAVLNARKSDLESYYHYVVGNGHKAKLRLCRLPGMTSLLLPDQNVLSHFAKFSEWGSVVSEHPVQTRRLDDIAEVRDLDFLNRRSGLGTRRLRKRAAEAEAGGRHPNGGLVSLPLQGAADIRRH